MKVKVKSLDGQKLELELEDTLPVPALKETLSTKTGANLNELKIIFKGKVPIADSFSR